MSFFDDQRVARGTVCARILDSRGALAIGFVAAALESWLEHLSAPAPRRLVR